MIWVSNVLLGPASTFSNSIKERPEKTYQQGPCWGRGYKEGSPCELEVKNYRSEEVGWPVVIVARGRVDVLNILNVVKC